MKKIENNFTVTGFLGKDAEIREFTNSSVARFPLARKPSGKECRGNQPHFSLYEY